MKNRAYLDNIPKISLFALKNKKLSLDTDNILILYDIVWKSIYKDPNLYDLFIPLKVNKYPKHAGDALSMHCKEGPLPYIISAFIRKYLQKQRINLVLSASIDENISLGLDALINILLKYYENENFLTVVLNIPTWSFISNNPLKKIIVKNIIRKLHLLSKNTQIRWIITEELSLIKSDKANNLILYTNQFSSNAKIFIACYKLPYIWGLYQNILEDRSVEISLRKNSKKFKDNLNSSYKIFFIKKLNPDIFFRLLKEKLNGDQDLYAWLK
ncbi:hypothetical protein GMMP15_1070007 [Candidatus Magnetomoraceae bacterium gMMP-15]